MTPASSVSARAFLTMFSSEYRHDGHGLQVVNDNRPRLTRSAINEADAPYRIVMMSALLRLYGLPANG